MSPRSSGSDPLWAPLLGKLIDLFRGPINWPKAVLFSVVAVVLGAVTVAYLDGTEKVTKIAWGTAQLARSINRIECVSAGTTTTTTDTERATNRFRCLQAFPPLEAPP